MPTAVAFFRNLNLGQGWGPRRPQLEQAFAEVGATGVDSVQVNGTVVFDHPTPVSAVEQVSALLGPLTGYDDVVVVRRASWLLNLVRRVEELELPSDLPVEVALFDARPPLPISLPWTSADGRLRVLLGDHRHAVASFHDGSGRGSNATVVLQEVTGAKVTSRGFGTVQRVAERIGKKGTPARHPR